MKCKHAKVLLSHYVEQTVDTMRREKLDRHLEECPTCRDEMNKMVKTVSIIRALEEVDPACDYLGAVKALLPKP
jgi:predicted anti-sigma-YlaC factor YlaD